MERTIAVFGASRSLPGDPHFEEAVRCGELLARAGFAVATGGYAGSMEAASLGARRGGGHVIGVTAPDVFPQRSGVNQHVIEEIPATTLATRISFIVDRTDGAIALWGSLGTATELLTAWNVAFVAPMSDIRRKPVVAVGEPWASMVPYLEDTLSTEPGIVTLANDVDAAVGYIIEALI